MGKVYSPEFKGQVCKRIIEGGEKVSQISIELDLHENTIYNCLIRTGLETAKRL